MNPCLRVVFACVALFCVRPGVAPAGEPPKDHWESIVNAAGERFGEAGSRAARFLAEHRSPRDADIDPEVVLDALGVALKARGEYPWRGRVPDDLFWNDVAPYAVLDEPRAVVRSRVHALAAPIVKGASSAAEAAQALNRDLFGVAKVKYSTQRRRANQNSIESMEQGLASCTGLSILLVEACRSVGIPARVAGVASWTEREGNHTWVEIHDGNRWRFTGAAEHDPAGLDRAWFTGAASRGVEGHERYASSRLHGDRPARPSRWRGARATRACPGSMSPPATPRSARSPATRRSASGFGPPGAGSASRPTRCSPRHARAGA